MCEFEILYGAGVSAAGEIVDLASEAGLCEKLAAVRKAENARLGAPLDPANEPVAATCRPSCATNSLRTFAAASYCRQKHRTATQTHLVRTGSRAARVRS